MSVREPTKKRGSREDIASYIHRIPTEDGFITVVEQPIKRVYGDPYPNVYPASGNVFWEVRYSLFERGEQESTRFCTLVVPCGIGWQSAPPDNTLSMLMTDGEETVNNTPQQAVESYGEEVFSEEVWKEIHKVWRVWFVALGEFFGPYFDDARGFLNS